MTMPSSQQLSQLYALIDQTETRTGKQLTRAARELVALPVAELLDLNIALNWDQTQDSIFKLISSVEPEKFFQAERPYNSRSIISAFHSQYCGIPPFCGPVRR